MAHTSPVYVQCGSEYSVWSAETAQYMMTLIDGSLTYVKNLSPQHVSGRATHHHGEVDHMAHLALPFEQAKDRLAERMRSRESDS